MPTEKLKAFLDENNVRYVTIRHSSAFTSQEIAASAHVSGKEFAKTVMIKINDKMAMAVLPASYQIDFEALKASLGTQRISLATEVEFKTLFPGCEVGAMPPFGNLYGMDVFVAESLAEDKEISFNAGTHTEIVRMSFADFQKFVKPKIFRFSWRSVSFPSDPKERWEE